MEPNTEEKDFLSRSLENNTLFGDRDIENFMLGSGDFIFDMKISRSDEQGFEIQLIVTLGLKKLVIWIKHKRCWMTNCWLDGTLHSLSLRALRFVFNTLPYEYYSIFNKFFLNYKDDDGNPLADDTIVAGLQPGTCFEMGVRYNFSNKVKILKPILKKLKSVKRVKEVRITIDVDFLPHLWHSWEDNWEEDNWEEDSWEEDSWEDSWEEDNFDEELLADSQLWWADEEGW
jgi:hypothetical protein